MDRTERSLTHLSDASPHQVTRAPHRDNAEPDVISREGHPHASVTRSRRRPQRLAVTRRPDVGVTAEPTGRRRPGPSPPQRLRVDARPVQRRRRAGDELLARRHVVAHQQIEHLLGRLQVGEVDPAQGAVPRIHRRLRQLVGVHLTETLVALDRVLVPDALALELQQLVAQLTVRVRVDVLVLALLGLDQLDAVQRRHRGEHPARLDHRPHVALEQRQQQASGCASRPHRRRSS